MFKIIKAHLLIACVGFVWNDYNDMGTIGSYLGIFGESLWIIGGAYEDSLEFL